MKILDLTIYWKHEDPAKPGHADKAFGRMEKIIKPTSQSDPDEVKLQVASELRAIKDMDPEAWQYYIVARWKKADGKDGYRTIVGLRLFPQ